MNERHLTDYVCMNQTDAEFFDEMNDYKKSFYDNVI